jgi:Zn-dependent protease
VSLETFLYLAPLILVSLVLHELAHALVATWLGDPTPREHGRLTLNPIHHLDPLGTAMFAITAFVSPFIFGWARPVLVQPRYFRRPQVDMALVAAAGPATNFLLALACVAYLIHGDPTGRAFDVALRAWEVNLVLGIFNLLPIPPLDGSRIVGAILPRDVYLRWAQLDQVGMLALFGLIFVFNEQFWDVFGEVRDRSAEFMVRIVGG